MHHAVCCLVHILLFLNIWFVFRYKYETKTIAVFWKFLVKPTVFRPPFDMNTNHNPTIKQMPRATFHLVCNPGIRWRKMPAGNRLLVQGQHLNKPEQNTYNGYTFPHYDTHKNNSSANVQNYLPERSWGTRAQSCLTSSSTTWMKS